MSHLLWILGGHFHLINSHQINWRQLSLPLHTIYVSLLSPDKVRMRSTKQDSNVLISYVPSETVTCVGGGADLCGGRDCGDNVNGGL